MKRRNASYWRMGCGMLYAALILASRPGYGVDGENFTAETSSDTASVFAPDTTPPGVFDIFAQDAETPNETVILWKTDEAATSRVEYGETPAYGFYSTYNPTKVVHHSATLTRLSPNTPHHYRVISQDTAGNTVVSENYTFTTQSDGRTRPRAAPSTFTENRINPVSRHSPNQ